MFSSLQNLQVLITLYSVQSFSEYFTVYSFQNTQITKKGSSEKEEVGGKGKEEGEQINNE
jgi:hypothetical protein